MDQIKTGRFIAQIRKEKNMTQKQLAEELLISDRTVSKWETGKGMPDVSLMMPLCWVLGITVNELLSGERISDEDYKKKAEENMVNILGEKKVNLKRLLTSTGIYIATGFAEGMNLAVLWFEELNTKAIIAIIISTVITLCLGIALATIVDRRAGYFECTKCHTVFTPDSKTYLKGILSVTPFIAYFHCPHCNKSTLCKRKITK